MLVTFKTHAYADITMFGDAAQTLLKLMGQSGNVPGALMAADVADALSQLRENLAEKKPTDESLYSSSEEQFDDDEEAQKVALSTRAMPLIELLEAAHAAQANVMWEE